MKRTGDIEEFLLEICIPTFMRPDSLISSVKTILECKDERFMISVSSNKPEPRIQKTFSQDSRVAFHYFEENQGFTKNVQWLLKNCSGKFVMLLSDEDSISALQLSKTLDFLENINQDVYTAYIPTQDNYSLGSLSEIAGHRLHFNEVMFMSPMAPTYMSGYIFRRATLSSHELATAFTDDFGNAYPFILLRNFLVRKGGKFQIARNLEIRKGEEVGTGGAMHTNKIIFNDTKTRSGSISVTTPQQVGPFLTSKDETEERFAFFLTHLLDLQEINLIYWVSVVQIANRMKSGTGMLISIKRNSSLRSYANSRPQIELVYHKKNNPQKFLSVRAFSALGLIVQKSAGAYRKRLSFRYLGE